jgi:xanthine/uracil permease
MLLALAFGGSIMLFLDQIPSGVLGVMLFISGHALAHTGWTMLTQETSPDKLPQESAIALLTMMVIVGLKKTHYGALAGLIAHLIYGDGLAVMRRIVGAASASATMPSDSAGACERESLLPGALPTTDS